MVEEEVVAVASAVLVPVKITGNLVLVPLTIVSGGTNRDYVLKAQYMYSIISQLLSPYAFSLYPILCLFLIWSETATCISL